MCNQNPNQGGRTVAAPAAANEFFWDVPMIAALYIQLCALQLLTGIWCAICWIGLAVAVSLICVLISLAARKRWSRVWVWVTFSALAAAIPVVSGLLFPLFVDRGYAAASHALNYLESPSGPKSLKDGAEGFEQLRDSLMSLIKENDPAFDTQTMRIQELRCDTLQAASGGQQIYVIHCIPCDKNQKTRDECLGRLREQLTHDHSRRVFPGMFLLLLVGTLLAYLLLWDVGRRTCTPPSGPAANPVRLLDRRCRVSALRLVLEQVRHENNLINQRMTWMLTLQGFLFAAYAVAIASENPSARAAATLCTVGAISTVLFSPVLGAGAHRLDSLNRRANVFSRRLYGPDMDLVTHTQGPLAHLFPWRAPPWFLLTVAWWFLYAGSQYLWCPGIH